MRFNELDQPAVGDILEIEIGDQVVEAVIAEINGDEIISETDNVDGGNLILENIQQDLEEAGAGVDTLKQIFGKFVPQIKDRMLLQKFQTAGSILSNMIGVNANNQSTQQLQSLLVHLGNAATSMDVSEIDNAMNFFNSEVQHWAVESQDKAALKGVMDQMKTYIGQSNAKNGVAEAEYQGREVKLGKPMAGDVKKFKVYVRNPKTGKTVKVNFGDPNMRIKKSNPARRRSFRARHNCDNPGPRTKARYWSCRKW